jgi:arylsulfatase A-like enzyme
LNDGGTPLRVGEETLATVLKRAGYACGGFGKWGCGGRGSTGVPERHGFDVFFGYYDQVHAHSYYPPYLIENSREVPLADNCGLGDGQTYSHYMIMEEAYKFIRANRNEPFFCYLPVTPPHARFDIPQEDSAWAMYEDKPWPSENMKKYAAMITMADRQLGELISLLDELGIGDKTIIFFCGDNGGKDSFSSDKYPRGFHAPNVNPQTGVAFRGQKGDLYEGGLKIPFIVKWPGKIPAGIVSDHLLYFPDVLPTFADLAGVPPPEGINGISFLPALLGMTAQQKKHRYLYWESGEDRAVRVDDWKAVRTNGIWELFDLKTDISESRDLYQQFPEILAQLQIIANSAHAPANPGHFIHRDLHERDRQAKFGYSDSKSNR